MYNIKTLRGTIFSVPIKYSKEFVQCLAGMVDGYMPIQVRDNGVLPILPIWRLTSPDEKDVLAFTGDKIDLMKIVEGNFDNNDIKSFAERCKKVFGRIMEVTGKICTRVALAPSVIVVEKGNKSTELFSRLYRIQKFGDVQLESSNVSQVYRVDKEIEGKAVRINFVANFYAESDRITENGVSQMRERYMCDFDINTMVNPDNKFTTVGINEFFEMAPECFKEFHELYFE